MTSPVFRIVSSFVVLFAPLCACRCGDPAPNPSTCNSASAPSYDRTLMGRIMVSAQREAERQTDSAYAQIYHGSQGGCHIYFRVEFPADANLAGRCVRATVSMSSTDGEIRVNSGFQTMISAGATTTLEIPLVLNSCPPHYGQPHATTMSLELIGGGTRVSANRTFIAGEFDPGDAAVDETSAGDANFVRDATSD